MKILFTLIGLAILTACNQAKESDSSGNNISSPAEKKSQSFSLLQTDLNTLPVKDSITGKVTETKSWTDAEGEHILVLSETEKTISKESLQTKRIYATCFVKENNAWRKKWQVQDHIEDCEMDANCAFYPGSLTVTDVDKNNIAEACFLYSLSCMDDVAPEQKKLILYEGLNKYAIRGTSLVEFGGNKEGGEKKIDASFNKAAKSILDLANTQWEKFGVK